MSSFKPPRKKIFGRFDQVREINCRISLKQIISKQSEAQSFEGKAKQMEKKNYSPFHEGCPNSSRSWLGKCKALIKKLFLEINVDLLELSALASSNLPIVSFTAPISITREPYS